MYPSLLNPILGGGADSAPPASLSAAIHQKKITAVCNSVTFPQSILRLSTKKFGLITLAVWPPKAVC